MMCSCIECIGDQPEPAQDEMAGNNASVKAFKGALGKIITTLTLDWMIQYCELEEAGWTPWLGGETPPETCSEILFRCGLSTQVTEAGQNCRWTHINSPGDIIGFKP